LHPQVSNSEMRTLWLLRHAKALAAPDGGHDLDRALSEDGRAQAKQLGARIKKDGVSFDLVLSSPALRARETAELVLQTANMPINIRYDQRIYDAADARPLLDLITEIADEHKTVLLVGHNPTIEELLRLLTKQMKHLSTASLAKITSKAQNWQQLAETTLHLESLTSA
jgi:phosphohistidine phosphatase